MTGKKLRGTDEEELTNLYGGVDNKCAAPTDFRLPTFVKYDEEVRLALKRIENFINDSGDAFIKSLITVANFITYCYRYVFNCITSVTSLWFHSPSP